jgi:CheY-like chemotaxis protein
VRIAAIAENTGNGIEAIIKYKPDIVFLDVQMPGMSGFWDGSCRAFVRNGEIIDNRVIITAQ